ncbi:inorganic phosphate transporter [Sulfurospirillum arcachonense]|uniref:inorganic phosphate transporter n=1 Tax=Sulfurospirillum arcachonense TaxID=57666 RepID=UPI00046846BB|nr:inorganic phosphate transporter [Sulfurospirillum arcachonense]
MFTITHSIVGGIFGVGFLREYLENTNIKDEIAHDREIIVDEKKLLKAYTGELKTLEAKEKKGKYDYERIVELYKMIDEEEEKIKEAKKHLKSAEKVKYVKRDALKKIVAAWVITVPAAAVLSALVYFMLRGMLLH